MSVIRGQGVVKKTRAAANRAEKLMNVLVLNAGSSTLKFQLIATDLERIKQNTDERLARGQVERIRYPH